MLKKEKQNKAQYIMLIVFWCTYVGSLVLIAHYLLTIRTIRSMINMYLVNAIVRNQHGTHCITMY